MICEVVNREHRGEASQHGVRRVQRLEINRGEARLPIVCVNDHGRGLSAGGELERGPDEHRKPERVVDVVVAIGGVKLLAVVQRRLIDEQRPRNGTYAIWTIAM